MYIVDRETIQWNTMRDVRDKPSHYSLTSVITIEAADSLFISLLPFDKSIQYARPGVRSNVVLMQG